MLCVTCGGEVLTDHNGNMKCFGSCGDTLSGSEVDEAFVDDELLNLLDEVEPSGEGNVEFYNDHFDYGPCDDEDFDLDP